MVYSFHFITIILDNQSWWKDPSYFIDHILSALEDPLLSFNTKELILSIIQRATVVLYFLIY